MESLGQTFIMLNSFSAFVAPGRLICVCFKIDGLVTTSWMPIVDNVKSYDFCLSQDLKGFILISGKNGYQIMEIECGSIALNTATTLQDSKVGNSVLFLKNTCLICDNDCVYVLDTTRSLTSDSLKSKTKVSVNSEIGPQNKLLLSKDKSVVCAMHKVNADGTDIIFVTENPTTGLCSIHWTTPELSGNTIQLKWSLTLTKDNIVLASNAIAPINSDPWACIIVGFTLIVLTQTGIIGRVELSNICPFVTGAVVLNCVTRSNTTHAIIDDTNESTSVTTATVLLSCVGDRYYALTLHITGTSCTAVNICERFFLIPTEETYAMRDKDTVRQTRTMLPCCESLKRVPSEWLQQHSNNHDKILILLGFHTSFGLQLIIEDSALPYISTDEWIKLVTAANKLQHIFFENHQAVSLSYMGIKDVTDTRRLLTSHYCSEVQQSAVYKLSQNVFYLDTRTSFELDNESFYEDTLLFTACSALIQDGSEASLLIMLSSRHAQQSTVYLVTSTTADNLYDQWVPINPARYQTQESSLGLFALRDCVAQVTTSGVFVWNNSINANNSWNQLLQEVVAKNMQISIIDQSRTCTKSELTQPIASMFRAQFVVSPSASTLIAIGEDIIVYLEIIGTKDNKSFSLSVTHVIQVHAAVCGVASEIINGEDAMLFLSFWPDPQRVNNHDCSDGVHIYYCAPSTGIQYMHQVEYVADGLACEPLRYLRATSLFCSSTIRLYALICAHPSGMVMLYHVLHHVRDNVFKHALVRTFHRAGGVEGVMIIESRAHHTFLLNSSACDYVVVANKLNTNCDSVNAENLTYISSWQCHEIVKSKSTHRASFTKLASAGEKKYQVAWIESTKLLREVNGHFSRASQVVHISTSVRFGCVHFDSSVMTDCAEERLFFPGQIVLLDITPDKNRFLVLTSHSALNLNPVNAPVLVAQQAVVYQGEVSVYDTQSFACVWRQQLSSADPRMPLLSMVTGPETSIMSGKVRSSERINTVLSLVHGHILSDVFHGPSAVLCAISLTTLQVTEENNAVVVAPTGSLRLFVDIRKLSQTPPVVESNTTTTTATPPPEPRLDGFINNALLCRALLGCVVLCLPGNTLSLVGWNKINQNDEKLKLSEYMRLDLQEKNAAVLEMIVVETGHIVLSLALVGLEIYSLIHGTADTMPTLQFTYALAGVGCLWTELYIKSIATDERTDDTNVLLSTQDKTRGTAQQIALFLPSSQSMLTGSILHCELESES